MQLSIFRYLGCTVTGFYETMWFVLQYELGEAAWRVVTGDEGESGRTEQTDEDQAPV